MDAAKTMSAVSIRSAKNLYVSAAAAEMKPAAHCRSAKKIPVSPRSALSINPVKADRSVNKGVASIALAMQSAKSERSANKADVKLQLVPKNKNAPTV